MLVFQFHAFFAQLAKGGGCIVAAHHANSHTVAEFIHDFSRTLLDLRQETLGEQIYQQGVASLDHDQLGFWERYGYHNDADPFEEQRYQF